MDRDAGYPDYRQRRAEERHNRRLAERQAAKQAEQAREDMYDRMVNPHLYGNGDERGGGGFRSIKPGEHYEEVQKKDLEYVIRVRERKKREEKREEELRMREREREEYHRGGRRDRPYPDPRDREFHPRDRGEFRGGRRVILQDDRRPFDDRGPRR